MMWLNGEAGSTIRRAAVACAISLFGLLVWTGGCSGDGGVDKPDGQESATSSGFRSQGATSEDGESTSGLQFNLSSLESKAPEADGARTVEGTPLSAEETQALLDRLPPLADTSSEETSFAFRGRSKPAPRAGETISTVFPPEESEERPDEPSADQSPRIVRKVPVGDVPMVPRVSVTFSKPMVSVGTRSQIDDWKPVGIKPKVEGTWRWIGTETLVFKPKADRLPMATEYTAALRSGTKAADGSAFDKAVEWSFKTPPLEVERWHPTGDSQPRWPLFFLQFNQRVDREKVLEYVKIWGGGEIYDLRLATDAEIQDDERVSQMADRAPKDQWIAFKTKSPLKVATQFKFAVQEGAPSAEGPLKKPKDSYKSFQTYEAFALEEADCGYRSCTPQSAWRLEFNNRIDADAFEASMVNVSPELKGAEIRAAGDQIVIQGRPEADTSYTVTVDGGLQDRFGQTLGSAITADFDVGYSEPGLAMPDRLIVPDPAAEPAIDLWSTSLETIEVTAYRVEPDEWPEFREVPRYRWDSQDFDMSDIPGTKLSARTVEVERPKGGLVRSRVALSDWLDGEYGHLVLWVEPGKPLPEAPTNEHLDRNVGASWVQVTDMALDVFAGRDETYAWVSNLADGSSVKGADVRTVGGKMTPNASTGGDGLASMSNSSVDAPGAEAFAWVASSGDDSVLVPFSSHGYRSVGSDGMTAYRWHTYSDRGLYRPGETVRVKGWVRRADLGEEGALEQIGAGAEVDWKVWGPRRNEIVSGTTKLSELGGFHMEAELPDDINLGDARVSFTLKDADVSTQQTFQVQEFRTPEFEVGVETSPGPHVVGDTVETEMSASYYSGGPLSGADLEWRVSSSEAQYSPPGWDDYTFGRWNPIWWGFDSSEGRTKTLEAQVDAAGKHRLGITPESVDPGFATSLDAEATVSDVSRQTITGSDTILVHPARAYIGLKTERHFVERGEPIEVEAIGVSIDGEPLEGRRLEIRAERLDWRRVSGEYKQVAAETQTCERASEGKSPVSCSFETPKGGRYRLTGLIRDEDGLVSETQRHIWVSGGSRPRTENVDMQEVDLIPDKSTYKPGGTAEVLVQSPFEDAEGILLVKRHDIVERRRFQIEGSSTRLDLDIGEVDIPNVNIEVQVIGQTTVENGPSKPAQATGSLKLDVSTASRRLDVSMDTGRSGFQPAEDLDVSLQVDRADGSPAANAEIALAVVDEAILATAGYDFSDPIPSFYPERNFNVRQAHLRSLVQIAAPELRQTEASERNMEVGRGAGGMGLRGTGSEGSGTFEAESGITARMDMEMAAPNMKQRAAPSTQGPTIDLRKDIRPIAYFGPRISTDGQGRASTSFELPDNLTRWRLMAVAVDDEEYFGTAEETVTTRLPVSARPSLPRFLNYGDQADLPVVIHNQTGEDRTVNLAARAANLNLDDPHGLSVDVPAGDRVEVRFPSTTKSAGQADLQFAVASGDWSDAVEESFPVWTPATTEAFATYGSVEDSNARVVQPIRKPEGVIPEFGDLNVTTSSTALQQLTDAFIYLVDYPYGCTEQISSRMLGVTALRDVLDVFESAEIPEEAKLREAMQTDIKELQSRQMGSGGFGFWKRGYREAPFSSIHATLALHRANKAGYEVPEDVLERALGYVRSVDESIASNWSTKVRNTIIAYSLYVLHEAGRRSLPKAEYMLKKTTPGESISFEGTGWLLSVLEGSGEAAEAVDETLRQLTNRITETASSAHFATNFGNDDGYVVMHSSRRADAVLLESWMAHRPDSDLVQKLVRGLQNDRVKGRWANTQENVFVLMALREYFDAYESQTPNFVARMWLGDGYMGAHSYSGRTTERNRVDVPMKSVIEKTSEGDSRRAPLTIQKQGQGRLYYRIGLSYAPESLKLDPMSVGFAVERSYEAVDDPDDVTRRDDGTWVVKSGSRVRVTLEMAAPARRSHVALVDSLPAGLEAVNPALATTGSVPDEDDEQFGIRPWWDPRWYEHQNLRTERVEAFATRLAGGVYTYEYVARATTPGKFVVPPAKAEEMYHPETFGRTGTARMVVRSSDSP